MSYNFLLLFFFWNQSQCDKSQPKFYPSVLTVPYLHRNSILKETSKMKNINAVGQTFMLQQNNS